MLISPTLAARFVVPGKREIFKPPKVRNDYPKVNPGLTAVATNATKAIPIVDTVVNELPQATPTRVQTIKTVGRKNFFTEMYRFQTQST